MSKSVSYDKLNLPKLSSSVRTLIFIEFLAAEGLEFGNSVYWIRFDEDHADKVPFLLLQNLFYYIFIHS